MNIKGLSKTYGNTVVVNKIRLELYENQVKVHLHAISFLSLKVLFVLIDCLYNVCRVDIHPFGT